MARQSEEVADRPEELGELGLKIAMFESPTAQNKMRPRNFTFTQNSLHLKLGDLKNLRKMEIANMTVKVIIVYESKYGNTKRVAETIMESLNEAGGIEASIRELKEVNPNDVQNYDAILIGSPNHMGGPTRGIKKFIDKLGKLQLEGKVFAVFDTYMGKDFEKAVKKMEEKISEKAPRLKKIADGLSIKVQGIKGPIAEGELQKCKEFGKNIATQLKKS
ncbi:flavodoxin family protein [Candidatus Bathyarchaeota archaeon]|nr:flavodoxin family protein [Candidatus Bathyarchaeota archaeon]